MSRPLLIEPRDPGVLITSTSLFFFLLSLWHSRHVCFFDQIFSLVAFAAFPLIRPHQGIDASSTTLAFRMAIISIIRHARKSIASCLNIIKSKTQDTTSNHSRRLHGFLNAQQPHRNKKKKKIRTKFERVSCLRSFHFPLFVVLFDHFSLLHPCLAFSLASPFSH